jgi:hypothetical protein
MIAPRLDFCALRWHSGAMKIITQCKVLDRFRVWLRFDDGIEGEVDFSPLAGRGVFATWNDEAVFRRAVIADQGRALEWPGEIDFCADALWLQLTGRSVEEIFPALRPLSTHA